MAVMPNMDRDRRDRPTAGPRMTRRAGGTQDSGQGAREPIEFINSLRNRRGSEAANKLLSKPRFGGTIPSPQQRDSMPSRRPAMEGGDRMERERVATLRSLLGQLEMPTPPMPTMRDVPDMSPEEIAPYNQPAMDINDVFFGPDRKRFDIVEFLMNLRGR